MWKEVIVFCVELGLKIVSLFGGLIVSLQIQFFSSFFPDGERVSISLGHAW